MLHLRSDMTGEVIGEWRINQLTVPSTTPRPSVEGGASPSKPDFHVTQMRKYAAVTVALKVPTASPCGRFVVVIFNASN